MDEAAMNQAFATLRDQFGAQLAGDQIGGEVKMRQALMTQLNVDESQADVLVKQLAHTGWVQFRGSGLANDDAGAALGLGGHPADAAGAQDAQLSPLGTGEMDYSLMTSEALFAGAAQPGMATTAGGNSSALGGAMVSASAEDAGRAAGAVPVSSDPTINPDLVNSEAADENPPDGSGYWQISGPPPAGVTAAAGGGG